MQVNLANTGTQVGTYIPLEQNCGAKTATTVAPPTTSQPSTTTTLNNTSNGLPTGVSGGVPTGTPGQSSSWSPILLLFIFFVFITVLCGLGYTFGTQGYVMFGSDSATPGQTVLKTST
jgi:hypothetical protein